MLAQNNFEYQRVFLPYGLHTPGEDRSGTLRSIFPLSLENCSVLDIGSANGFFCFEAEKRGATRVVGVELKDTRFHHSLILRDILRSKVEFLQKDILQEDLGEQFDYVLCLNVLHHVKYPMFMLRKLSQLTRKKLILEIPTLSDPKFLKTLPFLGRFLAPILNRIPLIGPVRCLIPALTKPSSLARAQ